MSALTGITAENADEFAEVVGSDSGGLILAIMGQMERGAQWTANTLADIREQQINELRQEFLDLYESMLAVADKSDSMRLHNALSDFHWRANFHYKNVSKGAI